MLPRAAPPAPLSPPPAVVVPLPPRAPAPVVVVPVPPRAPAAGAALAGAGAGFAGAGFAGAALLVLALSWLARTSPGAQAKPTARKTPAETIFATVFRKFTAASNGTCILDSTSKNESALTIPYNPTQISYSGGLDSPDCFSYVDAVAIQVSSTLPASNSTASPAPSSRRFASPAAPLSR